MQPPGGWAAFIAEEMGLPWYRIPIVIASAVVIYLGFMVLVRLFGARILTVTSGFDALVFIMLGAVAGRTILGDPPTVTAGVIGLATLMLMESIFGVIERTWTSRRLVSGRPVLVFVHGEAIPKACRRTHTSAADLNAAIRGAGLASPTQAQCIILEPHGSYSVIAEGTVLDPKLFTYVEGAAEYLFTDGG